MSQKIADEIMDKLYADANLLHNMCSVYPGDPDGEMTLDAMILEGIADTIGQVDWDKARSHNRRKLPKVKVTLE